MHISLAFIRCLHDRAYTQIEVEVMGVKAYVFPAFVFLIFAVAGSINSAQANSFCNVSGRKLSQGCGNNDLFTSKVPSLGPGTGIVFEDCDKFKTVSVYGVYPPRKMVKKLMAECEARNAEKNKPLVLYTDYEF